jgi:hypothetical protein
LMATTTRASTAWGLRTVPRDARLIGAPYINLPRAQRSGTPAWLSRDMEGQRVGSPARIPWDKSQTKPHEAAISVASCPVDISRKRSRQELASTREFIFSCSPATRVRSPRGSRTSTMPDAEPGLVSDASSSAMYLQPLLIPGSFFGLRDSLSALLPAPLAAGFFALVASW